MDKKRQEKKTGENFTTLYFAKGRWAVLAKHGKLHDHYMHVQDLHGAREKGGGGSGFIC